MAHGVPDLGELVDALRGFLEEDVMPGTEGRLSFMARVAANVAAMVEREITLGPALAEAHERRLDQLGQESDEALAAAIRAGQFDDRVSEVIDLIRATTIEKLSLWNPGYVDPEDAARIVRMPGEDR